jgi:hypothetical protein
MKPATLTDLMYAVTHDDEFDGVLLSSDVLHLLKIALIKKLGLTALSAPARVDLGNGHIMNITIEGTAPAPEQMKFQVQELRPEVLAAALLMEARLREKDADKGQRWKESDIDNLQVCAATKVYQIDRAIQDGTDTSKHAIDLANYAMMIADVAGALESEASNGGAGWAGLDQVQMP